MPGGGERGRKQGRGQLGQTTKGGPGPEARGQVAGGAKANREAIELLFLLQSPLDSLRRKPLFTMVVKSTDFGVLKTLVTFLCFSATRSPGRCGFKHSNACLPVMSDGLPPVPRHQAPVTFTWASSPAFRGHSVLLFPFTSCCGHWGQAVLISHVLFAIMQTWVSQQYYLCSGSLPDIVASHLFNVFIIRKV